MVLVGVREDERLHLVEPSVQVAEVRQDQVHAGLVGVGEQHAAVHDEQAAAVLEDRHVPADLAEAAERDDAQAVACELAGRGEVRVRVAHAPVPCCAVPGGADPGGAVPGNFTPPAVRSSAS